MPTARVCATGRNLLLLGDGLVQAGQRGVSHSKFPLGSILEPKDLFSMRNAEYWAVGCKL